MTPRDKRKTEMYFTKYIRSQRERISRFDGILTSLSDPTRQKQCKMYLAGYYRDLISAEYSAGYEKKDIAEDVTRYLGLLGEIGAGSYSAYADALSFAVLFETDVETVMRLHAEEYTDSLTMKLEQYLLTNETDQKENTADQTDLKYGDYYGPFEDYLEGKTDGIRLKEYIESEWYQASNELYWYDSLKSPDDLYTGYWCWIGGAVYRIKDEQVTGEYIPADLL